MLEHDIELVQDDEPAEDDQQAAIFFESEKKAIEKGRIASNGKSMATACSGLSSVGSQPLA